MDKFKRVNLVLTQRDAEDLVETLEFAIGQYRDAEGEAEPAEIEATDRLVKIAERLGRLLSSRVH